MILVGGCISLTAVSVQSGLLLSGYFTPLVLFPARHVQHGGTGHFTAIRPIRRDGKRSRDLPARQAGIGVFAQNFLGAGFAQIYGLLADEVPAP